MIQDKLWEEISTETNVNGDFNFNWFKMSIKITVIK